MIRRVPVSVLLAVLIACSAPLTAQWGNYSTPDTPRLADGKPNLSALAPRAADGHPDLSGTWENEFLGFGRRGGGAAPPPPVPRSTFFEVGGFNNPLPLTPWAAALKKERMANNSKDNPDAWCLPMGLMQFHNHPQPRKIIQGKNLVVIIYEANYGLRQIFLDGRPAPSKDAEPWWYGYSRGRWDGDALVVETTNFRDGGWLDVNGSPLTDQGRLTERFTRPDFGHLDIEVTIEDPKAYTKPFTVSLAQRILVDADMIEFICHENEQSSKHFAK